MKYIDSKFKKPQYKILWFFFIIISLYEFGVSQHFHLNFLLAILIQYALLYIMYYLYVLYLQTILRFKELPTNINFKKINLGFNFREPIFNYTIEEDNYLMFEVYLHNDYFLDDYPHKDTLNENLRYHIHTVWKHVLLHLKKYKLFLAKILMYCFLFGIFILVSILIPYQLMGLENLYQKLYIFFVFVTFSFWLYLTILILSSEAIIGNLNNHDTHEIYAIYNNANIFMQTQELLAEINRSNDLIGTYINISSSILYFAFLTILGSIL